MSILNLFRRPKPIPRIIHQIWHEGEPPQEFTRFIDSWMEHHPRWKLWGFREGFELIAKHYPQLLPAWHSLPKDVQRADLLRYVILHRYGGVYADMDTEALRPLDTLIQDADFVAGYEAKPYPSICNAILASTPKHPILTAMLRYLAASSPDQTEPDAKDVSHVFATTGSLALTPIILANATDRTRILPTPVLYPFSWAEKHRCNESFPESWTKHYWASGWYQEGRYQVNEYWSSLGYGDGINERKAGEAEEHPLAPSLTAP